jgi:ubiquinone/menaquinone biosynthesis C-methylase UbiE
MSIGKSQGQIFLEGEGDGYYDRNKSALEKESHFYCEEVLCNELLHFREEIKQIVEVGCSSGVKLEYLCKFFAAAGSGIEPSSKAVAAGSERLRSAGIQNVGLKIGTADALPFEKHRFDLVYFAFCLYLVDRDKLFAAVAEADRVLRPGGFLAIVDFDPLLQHKRSYHHRDGIFSYKQQYANLFLASGQYYMVSKHSFSHSGLYFARDSNERVSLSLLYKEPDAYQVNVLQSA